MSAGAPSGSNQDFDLNIAPIIDCFTVLITYLLVSASFLSLSVLDIGVAANGTAAVPDTTIPLVPPVMFALRLDANKVANFKVTGGKQNLDLNYPVPPKSDGDWDTDSLVSRVNALKAQWPDVSDISVSAELTVRYKDIIKVIDPLKKNMPKVFLAGQ